MKRVILILGFIFGVAYFCFAPQIEIRKASGGSSGASSNYVDTSLNNASNSLLTSITSSSSTTSNGLVNLISPFIVIDNVPFYPTNPWVHSVDEEFLGNPTSAGVANGGANAWQFLQAGGGGTTNQSTLQPPIIDSSAYGFISITTTNGGQPGVAQTFGNYVLGAGTDVNCTIVPTNAEIICFARFRIGTTNTVTDIAACSWGLMSYARGTNMEPTNGVYILQNTNVATNSFFGVTSRANTRTLTLTQHASNTWSGFTWVVGGFRIDATGTNATFFCGPGRTNLTTFCTNTANIPENAALMPTFVAHRIAPVGGTTFITNYLDYAHLWFRRTSANY